MKFKFKEVRPPRTKSYLKHKLISATAMLLVSSILMVSTSYAWYVLSTAPEVSNIKTQVGANGALEIALLNADSWNDLGLLDMGDIDESVTDENPIAATTANLTWGNLVNLDDASYGLDSITLQPSRLYIEQDGTGYKVNSVPLKVPVYGEDGRVKSLDKTSAVAYSYANSTFSNTTGYGVRAVGTSATMSVFQLGMNAARSNLVTYSASARTAASNSLQNTGGALANVVIKYALSSDGDSVTYTNADVAEVKKLAVGLQGSLDEIETALRYAFAGYITTSGAYYVDSSSGTATNVNISAENYQTKLAEIVDMSDTGKTLSALLTEYPGITNVIPNIGTYITTLDTNQTKVVNAISQCGTLNDDSHTWSELAGIIYPLMNTDAMLVNGKNIETLKSELIVNGSIAYDKAFELVSGGITITVPSGSGLLSDIADYAGDYTANVEVRVTANLGGQQLNNVPMPVVMTTATTVNPVYLTVTGNCLKAATVADAVGSNSITDYYGYAIDLAFRTNAEESDLQLQTEPENRIYEGDERNASLQGGGSYMSFTTTAGLSATKMVKLMSGIRVVLAEPLSDGTMEILAIAALDTTLGKDVYTAITDDNDAITGYYLDGSAGAYQNSDIITTTQYGALGDTSAVTFNKTTGKVTAKLYIYDYEMTKSTTVDASGNTVVRMDGEGEDAKPLYTGGITLKDKVDNGTITALFSDLPQKVTALVYLDGSVVNNSTVAANSAQSMAGTLNLQFSSSATLVPAEITKLQTEGSAVNYTLMEGELYEAGYLYYGGYLGKVNSDYAIYTGSDDKIYYATGESGYAELTMDNITTALTPVTATLSASAASIAVDGTSNLTAAISDNTLTVESVEFGQSGGCATLASNDGDDNMFTNVLTGLRAGQAVCDAKVTVKIGGMPYRITSNTVTVTVTDATGGDSGTT